MGEYRLGGSCVFRLLLRATGLKALTMSSEGPASLKDDNGSTSSERSDVPEKVEAFRRLKRGHLDIYGLRSLEMMEESLVGGRRLAIVSKECMYVLLVGQRLLVLAQWRQQPRLSRLHLPCRADPGLTLTLTAIRHDNKHVQD